MAQDDTGSKISSTAYEGYKPPQSLLDAIVEHPTKILARATTTTFAFSMQTGPITAMWATWDFDGRGKFAINADFEGAKVRGSRVVLTSSPIDLPKRARTLSRCA